MASALPTAGARIRKALVYALEDGSVRNKFPNGLTEFSLQEAGSTRSPQPPGAPNLRRI